MVPETLVQAFQEEFSGPGWKEARILVALSGGLDSLVLLHLLRFSPGLPGFDLRAAHFDHGMRESSRGDAEWVRGLCRAWQVPLHSARASRTPSSEEEARKARYDFLLMVKAREGADWLFTAHHGDDQAETVLFRVFRGTGLAGLAGIPRRRSPGIFRPLLDVPRERLEAYARDRRIRPREDPSNRDLRISRNALRHTILPEVERRVAPGARRSLRRLARLARENEVAWESIIPELLAGLVEEDSRGIFLHRDDFLSQQPAVRSRLLRALLKRRGIILDEAGTRRVLEFTRTVASGRVLELPGGGRFRREYGRFLLEEGDEAGRDLPLVLADPMEGSGRAVMGGRVLTIRWGTGEMDRADYRIDLPLSELEFPLQLRSWYPGDRISLSYGTKKLKKLLAEAGVPSGARRTVPVLLDAGGKVLWVVGIAVAASVKFGEGRDRFSIGIDDVHEP